MTANDKPERTWPDLTAVLEGLPWAVAGAVATRRYMPERATADLDVVVLARDGAAARDRFARAGFAREGELTIGGATFKTPDGIRIDIIEGKEPWWRDALAETDRDRQGLPVLRLPYLVLMKLLSSRPIDLGDLTRMLGFASDADLVDVRDVVRSLKPGLSEDLESLIALGKLEQQGSST